MTTDAALARLKEVDLQMSVMDLLGRDKNLDPGFRELCSPGSAVDSRGLR